MEKRKDIPINSLEGFVRQLIGWREYQRSLYVCHYQELTESNHFGHENELNWNIWHGQAKTGTGMQILDNEIKKCLEYGYSHHIVRLMIFLNIFNLLEIKQNQVVQWFMEMIPMDAYHWVMISNISSSKKILSNSKWDSIRKDS